MLGGAEHPDGGIRFHQPPFTAITSPYLATSLLRCFLISLKKLIPWGIVP